MTTEDNNTQDDSLLNKWGKAGSSLGDIAARVGKQVKDDISGDEDEGFKKFESEASQAVDAFKNADSKDDYLDAGKDILKDAGEFIKDVAGSVKSAFSDAKDSAEATEVKAAFSSAVESSRDKFDDTVDNVRAKKAKTTPDSVTEPEADIIDGEVISSKDDGTNGTV